MKGPDHILPGNFIVIIETILIAPKFWFSVWSSPVFFGVLHEPERKDITVQTHLMH